MAFIDPHLSELFMYYGREDNWKRRAVSAGIFFFWVIKTKWIVGTKKPEGRNVSRSYHSPRGAALNILFHPMDSRTIILGNCVDCLFGRCCWCDAMQWGGRVYSEICITLGQNSPFSLRCLLGGHKKSKEGEMGSWMKILGYMKIADTTR